MKNELEAKYLKTPYEELTPYSSPNPMQTEWKFNSVSHFISWVEHLDRAYPRGSRHRSSEENDFNFTSSHSLADAYEVIRKAKFESKDTDGMQTMISSLRKRVKFSNEGHEIDVPEFVAGSDKYWLEDQGKKSLTRFTDSTLFLDGVYNSGRDAETCKKIGLDIINGIYKRKLIPRKMVVVFVNTNSLSSTDKDILVFIDVKFSDLNGLAKALHPSTFRRVMFRILEIYPSINSGYGRPRSGGVEKGYISIDNVYASWDNKSNQESFIKTFLGI